MNENNHRFLPIGTVVLLKGANKNVMIDAYCVFSTNASDEKKMFEYGACIYPEGIINSSDICAFNHDDIDKIIHLGLQNDDFKEFSKKMEENYDNYKKMYENK